MKNESFRISQLTTKSTPTVTDESRGLHMLESKDDSDSLHVENEIANRQRRTSITCCLSSLTICIRYGTQTFSWIEPKNW